jgi:hypothetical protein
MLLDGGHNHRHPSNALGALVVGMCPIALFAEAWLIQALSPARSCRRSLPAMRTACPLELCGSILIKADVVGRLHFGQKRHPHRRRQKELEQTQRTFFYALQDEAEISCRSHF